VPSVHPPPNCTAPVAHGPVREGDVRPNFRRQVTPGAEGGHHRLLDEPLGGKVQVVGESQPHVVEGRP